jgi:hypothetical protein
MMSTMHDLRDDLQFPFKPSRMVRWLLLFLILGIGFAWMGWMSRDPHFYDRTSGRHAWFGELMHELPIGARVGLWFVLAMLALFGGGVFLRRWRSGLAPLRLSPQGITGFTKGVGLHQTTIAWNDISKVSVVQANLIITGAAVATGARKPKPPMIVVNTAMIGEKKPNKLLDRIAEYEPAFGAKWSPQNRR